jgi:hypothetical protein
MTQRGHRGWLYAAICFSVLAVLDLMSIVVENSIPDSIRCGIVNAVLSMSLPFDSKYKLKEETVRKRTSCM